MTQITLQKSFIKLVTELTVEIGETTYPKTEEIRSQVSMTKNFFFNTDATDK
jgi:hypothetical protein